MTEQKLTRVQERPEEVAERFLSGGGVADRGQGAAALPGGGWSRQGPEEQLLQYLIVRFGTLQQPGEPAFRGADFRVDAVAIHDMERLRQVRRHVSLALAGDLPRG